MFESVYGDPLGIYYNLSLVSLQTIGRSYFLFFYDIIEKRLDSSTRRDGKNVNWVCEYGR